MKSKKLGLELTEDSAAQKTFGDWRKEINGTQSSNMTIIDEAVGQLQEDVQTLNDGGLVLKDTVIDSSVKSWLTAHPEATTTVQDGSITADKLAPAVKQSVEDVPGLKQDLEDHEERIAALEEGGGGTLTKNDYYREIDLNAAEFDTNRTANQIRIVNPETMVGRFSASANYTGFESIGLFLLYLKEGDEVITNADTFFDDSTNLFPKPTYVTQGFRGALLSRFVNNAETNATVLSYGREVFDGSYVTIPVTESNWYVLNYKSNVDYDVHFFVKHNGDTPLFSGNENFEEIHPHVFDCQVNSEADLGRVNSVSPKTTNGATGTYQKKVTELITISGKKGYSLVVDGVWPNNYADTGANVAFYTDSTGVEITGNGQYFKYAMDKRYITIPLTDEELNFRVVMNWRCCTPFVRYRIVPNEYLFAHNMVFSKRFYGKSILAFGDSYVHGHNLGNGKVWYALLAKYCCSRYVEHGHNGAGLCRSSAVVSLLHLLSELDDPADVIFFVCGRNDNSTKVPIGTPDDIWNPDTDTTTPSTNTNATFFGGLNYLLKYVLDANPEKEIIAVTPWSFTPLYDDCLPSKSYIDAIKVIAEKYSVECLNAAGDCGIRVQTEGFRQRYFLSSTDQSHLNATGHELMLKNAIKVLDP